MCKGKRRCLFERVVFLWRCYRCAYKHAEDMTVSSSIRIMMNLVMTVTVTKPARRSGQGPSHARRSSHARRPSHARRRSHARRLSHARSRESPCTLIRQTWCPYAHTCPVGFLTGAHHAECPSANVATGVSETHSFYVRLGLAIQWQKLCSSL